MTGRWLFYLLPAVTMSLGWGLRGTIGGGPVGAMIPGAMVVLSLCHLLGWKQHAAVAAAFGAIGIGLGGQMTYGQTIGFIRDGETFWWGLLGLTTKGAAWGLSGGALAGVGLMCSKYGRIEILVGLLLMNAATYFGWKYVDLPKLMYFSNRLDKPREEVWFGLTLGAIALLVFLWSLRRERISHAFAAAGLIGGGLGFGGGSLFIRLGAMLEPPYRQWPWWKSMEFTFGLLFGLALGAACFHFRERLSAMDWEAETADRPLAAHGQPPLVEIITAGLAVVCLGLWFQFSIPYRAMFSVVGACLLAASAYSPHLAWQVGLSMTTVGFLRDWLYKTAAPAWLETFQFGWSAVFLLAVPVVILVAMGERSQRLTARSALIVLTVVATFFGLVKVLDRTSAEPHLFVPLVFLTQAIIVIAGTLWTRRSSTGPHTP